MSCHSSVSFQIWVLMTQQFTEPKISQDGQRLKLVSIMSSAHIKKNLRISKITYLVGPPPMLVLW
jgi:hypothetical protein